MAKAKRSSRTSAPKQSLISAREWPQLLGEAVLLTLVVTVPIALSLPSENPVDIKDVVLGLGVACGLSLWLIASLVQRRVSWVRSCLTPLVLAYLLWAALSISYSRYRFMSLGEVGHLAANVGLFCLVLVSIRTLSQVRRLIAAACLAAAAVSLYAFCQATGHDFVTWSSTGGRVSSFLGNPTYLGGFIALVMPLAAVAAWSSRRAEPDTRHLPSLPITILLLFCLLMMAVTAYLSFTIAVAIGLGLGSLLVLGLTAARAGRAAVRKAALIAVILLAFALPGARLIYQHMPSRQQARVQQVIHLQDPTASDRQLHWRVAFELFRQRPLLGDGYGAFRAYALARMSPQEYTIQSRVSHAILLPTYAHNEYLQVLADTGLVGGALFLALLLAVYATLLRVCLCHPDAPWRRLGLGAAVAITAFLFQNGVGVTFRETGAVMFFWLWLGLLALAATGLPRGAASPSCALYEWRPRRLPRWGIGLTAVSAAGLLLLLSWVGLRRALADVTVREAELLATEGHYREAAAACHTTLALCPDSWLAYYTLAYAEGQLGRPRQAAEACRQTLRLLPGNANAYYNLGVAYRQLGRLPEAVACFRTALRLLPFEAHYLGLAEALLAQGHYAEADRQARAALARDPQSTRIRLLLADIAAHRNGIQSARTPRVLARQDPGIADARSAEQLLDRGDCRDALPHARNWARLDPNSTTAYSTLGACQFNTGDLTGAEHSLHQALALSPHDVHDRFNLANTYGRLGDTSDAVRQLQQVVTQGGGSPEAKQAAAMLAKLHSAASVPRGQTRLSDGTRRGT